MDMRVVDPGGREWGAVFKSYLVAIVAVGFVAVIGGVTNWFGLASPRFEPGVQYEFFYSYEMKGVVPDQPTVTARVFQVDQSTIFSALVEGPRGERAAFEDLSLPPNTFIYEQKTAPPIVVGDQIAQGSYNYLETRFNINKKEEQHFTPEVPGRH